MKPDRLPRSLAPFLLVSALGCAGGGRALSDDGRPSDGALQAPREGRLAQDVCWLAADERDGRRAGTGGEAAAAHWIAQRLEALGLEPAGTDGYLQSFEVPLPVRDAGHSALRCEDPVLELAASEQLVPLFCSQGGEARGPLVFAGYGISATEVGRDDYAGLDVTGAVVLLVRGTPPDSLLPAPESAPEAPAADNPHGGPAPAASGWGPLGSIFHKVMEARRRGASAVLVAQHPGRDEPMLSFSAGGSAEAHLPALHLSAALAEQLLPGYAQRVAALDAGTAAAPAPGGPTLVVRADVERRTGKATNVLGLLRGRHRERTLLIGAHFDHLGRGGPGSLAPADQQGQVHNGADDNASGTAAVLEIARVLAAGPPPEGDVLIALWSGEELGLLGSEHWARNPTIPLEQVRANLNLDMVGRAGSHPLAVLGAGSAQEFSGWLAAAGPRAGLELQVNASGQGVGGSDHQTFLKRDIPALHFFSGLHSDYHRPSDDYERFEAEGARRTAELVLELVGDIQAAPTLAWVAPTEEAAPAPRGGFRTRFGSVPDYAFTGAGMRLDGTSPGGPAEKAGLLRGDVIVAVGDQAIEGVGDFMFALNAHKPGDVVLVHFLRDGAQETCTVTLESSQLE